MQFAVCYAESASRSTAFIIPSLFNFDSLQQSDYRTLIWVDGHEIYNNGLTKSSITGTFILSNLSWASLRFCTTATLLAPRSSL